MSEEEDVYDYFKKAKGEVHVMGVYPITGINRNVLMTKIPNLL
jgi:hypothetical protein